MTSLSQGQQSAAAARGHDPSTVRCQRPTVCFWLIGNPVSGQGKGASVIYGIAAELVKHLGPARVRTLTAADFFSTFCAGKEKPNEVDLNSLCTAVQEMNHAALRQSSFSSSSPGDGKTQHEPEDAFAGVGNVCVFIVLTQHAKDGVHVARAVATMTCHTRWRKTAAAAASATSFPTTQTPPGGAGEGRETAEDARHASKETGTATASHQWLHVVGVVGGDGSLSDVVNGLCWGTLASYKQLTADGAPKLRARDQQGSTDEPLSLSRAAPQQPVKIGTSPSSRIRGPGIATHIRKSVENPTPLSTSLCAKAKEAPVEGETFGVRISSSPSENSFAEEEEEDVIRSAVTENACRATATAAAAHSQGTHQQQQQRQPQLQEGRENDSHYYYWQVATDKTVLRNLLPGLLYAPGGTGADFAKMKLCCGSAKEVVTTLSGVVHDFVSHCDGENFSSGSSRRQIADSSSCDRSVHERSTASSLTGCDAVMGEQVGRDILHKILARRSFLSYEVDVGRVTFPKSGHSTFFINECSIGMSCDVVERGEHFKRSKVMTALGGRLLFASSAAISLLLMAPKKVRMARLAPMPRPPSAFGNVYSPTVAGLLSSSEPLAHPPAAAAATAAVNASNGTSDAPALVDDRVVAEARLPLHLRDSCAAWGSVKQDEEFFLSQQWQQGSGDGAKADEREREASQTIAQLKSDYYRFFDASSNPNNPQPSAFYQMPNENELLRVSCKGAQEEVLTYDRCSLDERGTTTTACTREAIPVFCETPAAIQALLDLPHAHATRNATSEDLLQHFLPSKKDKTPRWVYCESSTWAFGNGRWYGGGMHVTPHGNPTDGLLSCTNWVATVLPFVSGVFSLYTGKHVKWESTTALDGERFVVDVGPLSEKAVRKNKAAHAKEVQRRLKQQQQERQDGEEGARQDQKGAAFNKSAQPILHDWRDERLPMLMEADGELLEELPAVVELGGMITFFTPNTDMQSQWKACFGPPAPGTTRAWQAAESFQLLSHAPRTEETVRRSSREAQQCQTAFKDEWAAGTGEPHSPSDDPLASSMRSNHAQLRSTERKRASSASATAVKVVVRGGEGEAAPGWIERGWRGVKRWLTFR